MDRQTVELTSLGFQALITALLALVYYGLWRQQRRAYFATWAAAWAFYAMRLGCISAFIRTRDTTWLFFHQSATGFTALLLLLAALQFSRGVPWRRRYLWFGVAWSVWSYIAIFRIHDFAVSGISAAVLLSAVTLWTGFVFWQHRRRARSTGATVLAVTFTLWGLHHLDYPLLRPLGSGVLYGVYVDVLFIMATAIGILFLVVSRGRETLEARRAELEQLTHLLLTAQEDERRRIARELHDEAGQVLTAVKIDLDLAGRHESSELVGKALAQVRDLSNLLRPTVLDDLGLVPALRALLHDFGARTRIEAALDTPGELAPFAPERQVVIYRVVQEALTNVARHASAAHVDVRLEPEGRGARLTIIDDGRGPGHDWTPHLGLMGMRERVTGVGGTLEVGEANGAGFRVIAVIPEARP